MIGNRVLTLQQSQLPQNLPAILCVSQSPVVLCGVSSCTEECILCGCQSSSRILGGGESMGIRTLDCIARSNGVGIVGAYETSNETILVEVRSIELWPVE